MKRIILSVILVIMIAGSASARSSIRVSNASEFQKALDNGVSDITITSSFSGNFVIPRWVYSISGTSSRITITPSDESKPVFDAESSTKKNLVRAAEVLLMWPGAVIHGAVSNATSDSLKFSDLTILCGTNTGIDTDSLSKQVYVSNVTFKGIRNRDSGKFSGMYPSTKTNFSNCTFEDLTWGVSTISASGYDIKIDNCTFKNVHQALSVSNSLSSAKASITKCKGENLGWWVIQHEAGTLIMYVTVDQATIDSYSKSNYYHKTLEALTDNNSYNSKQYSSFIEDLTARFKALTPEARNLINKEKLRGWDNIRIYAMTELTKKLREGDVKKHNEITALYALLASAPVAALFDLDGSIPFYKQIAMCADTLSSSVKDKNLIMPIVYSFLDGTELAPLSRTSSRISWGNSGNVNSALSKIDQRPDRIFRENIHRLQDWLTDLNSAQKMMNDLRNDIRSELDYSTLSDYERTIRNIYDLAIASNRVAAAIFFDLPTDLAFVVNFASVSEASNKSQIIGTCRELGSFYSLSQRLCVLNRTNTIRNEILKLWKSQLVESHWFSADDNSKYEELVASLSTDPDLMRDASRINDFFREWR